MMPENVAFAEISEKKEKEKNPKYITQKNLPD